MAENNYDDVATFLKSVPKDMESGKKYQWKCPVCSGVVNGSRDQDNNHLHANCESCGMAIKQ